jgi:hypothetical protein
MKSYHRRGSKWLDRKKVVLIDEEIREKTFSSRGDWFQQAAA